MTYRIIETAAFRKQFQKLDQEVQRRFVKQFRRLQQDPRNMGKPLGHPDFRELKQTVFRVYYIILRKDIVVVLVGVSDKDTQQQAITLIRQWMKEQDRPPKI